ncbi:MAG: hypothetical protein V3U73_11450, partial [bacterium]
QEQFDLNIRMRDRISESRMAVAKIRAVRGQIDSIANNAQSGGEVLKKSEAVKKKLSTVEEALIQTREGKVGAQLKPKLVRQLTYLYGMTTTADQKPGRDAHKRLADIEEILAAHLAKLQRILDTDVAELNAMLKNLGAVPVEVGD